MIQQNSKTTYTRIKKVLSVLSVYASSFLLKPALGMLTSEKPMSQGTLSGTVRF